MIAKSFSTAAIVALVAVQGAVAAQPKAHQFTKNSLSSLLRRDDTPYQPTQEVCGEGDTCAEACGAGYDVCASTDKATHCYNAGIGEICCSDNTGNSCETGFYCASDSAASTYCCASDLAPDACAAQYSGVVGSLVSQTPKPTSASSTSSSASATSTITTSSITDNNQTITLASSTSTSCTTTVSAGPSIGYPSSNTTSPSYVASVSPTPTTVVTGAADTFAPAGALFFVAAAFAALL